jgi:hypothetical protein
MVRFDLNSACSPVASYDKQGLSTSPVCDVLRMLLTPISSDRRLSEKKVFLRNYKNLSKIACQVPKPVNPLLDNNIRVAC